MKTNSKVKKWGNSLAVRLPSSVTDATGISDDTDVKITTHGSSVTITPLTKKKKLSAEDLFEGVTSENAHKEFDWGPDVGAERWYDDEG